MQIRFLLGPAGSGKTFRCLAEIRKALLEDPEGPPLLLLAPKQATFQLERQLLGWNEPESGPSAGQLFGYTRLQILSFERLAAFILDEFAGVSGNVLREEGRVMVLRALLARNQSQLRTFHATARLPGFARQVNLLLREFQRQQISASQLGELSRALQAQPTLSGKLHDAAFLLRAYLDWLKEHELQDSDGLPDLAARTLQNVLAARETHLRVAGLWMDGFAEMTPQEMDLLTAFLPICDRALLAFCLDPDAGDQNSWLSVWPSVHQTFHACHERIAALRGAQVTIEKLSRDCDSNQTRFAGNPSLEQLERAWARAPRSADSLVRPLPTPARQQRDELDLFAWSDRFKAKASQPLPHETASADRASVRLVTCTDPDAEAVLAAREILQFVRGGGRLREAAVLVRKLDDYYHVVRRVFQRYGLPCFLDQRQPIAHHPLAELTRYALRMAAFGWQHEDWFGALKTGLATDDEGAGDKLENEALARGWRGDAWVRPVIMPDDPGLEQALNRWLGKVIPPFAQFDELLQNRRPTGRELADAFRRLWDELAVEETLERWSASATEPATMHFSAVHLTVLDQMHEWLANLELAFAGDALSLPDWIPILEAGLANLSVGVIPPTLDQVLIGAIDRSRNPELRLTVLIGWNETIFPQPPSPGPLLSEAEREALANRNVRLGPGLREQVSRERYYAYIALTRARQRLVVTCATQDSEGQPLNPSPFFDQLQQITAAPGEKFSGSVAWDESEHACELAGPVLRAWTSHANEPGVRELGDHAVLAPLVSKWSAMQAALNAPGLSAASAAKLYGRELRSSVSGLEDFAACPFRFFAARGLRLEERKEFQYDDRDKGSFQHEILREFHQRVRASGRRWRDLNPGEARALVTGIARELLPHFGGGRFLADGASRFTGNLLIERLGRLITAIVEWLPQYRFDTELVELAFGMEDGLPPWRIELPGDRALLLRGRIDRVDLCRAGDRTLAVVMDYKSSARKLDAVKLHHGLELQLLSYLGVLHHLTDPEKHFGAKELCPAGVFYVPLNGGHSGAAPQTRTDILMTSETDRRIGYQHRGRFLAEALEYFDSRGAERGDQFKFQKTRSGELSARGNEAMASGDFEALREKVEAHLREYGARIFSGETGVSPFRIGQETACKRCDFRAVCRFDSWTQPYRELRRRPKVTKESMLAGTL